MSSPPRGDATNAVRFRRGFMIGDGTGVGKAVSPPRSFSTTGSRAAGRCGSASPTS
jgi:hypothetical protein